MGSARRALCTVTEPAGEAQPVPVSKAKFGPLTRSSGCPRRPLVGPPADWAAPKSRGLQAAMAAAGAHACPSALRLPQRARGRPARLGRSKRRCECSRAATSADPPQDPQDALTMALTTTAPTGPGAQSTGRKRKSPSSFLPSRTSASKLSNEQPVTVAAPGSDVVHAGGRPTRVPKSRCSVRVRRVTVSPLLARRGSHHHRRHWLPPSLRGLIAYSFHEPDENSTVTTGAGPRDSWLAVIPAGKCHLPAAAA